MATQDHSFDPQNQKARWKDRMGGSLWAFIGFMLSPLSWWNDLFINVPLAVGFGGLVAAFYRPAFDPAVVLGYWLTNILGLVLMHQGVKKALGGAKAYTRRELAKDLLISLLYTGLIAGLLKLEVIRPVQDYLSSP